MNVLLVGSGGREHALAWRLSHCASVRSLHAAPGNPGIAQLGTCHPVRAEDGEGLLAQAHGIGADLVVIGPEAPLVAGVGDQLRRAGLAVFGPSAAAARIEGSKSFAKEVMAAAGVPTAETMAVARPPCVVKADGLAAGKGVHVCTTQAELDAALRAVTALGDAFVVEELLEGEEVSVFALCDGRQALVLPAAQDFKRVGDGDAGPNTGGMGAYAPVPWFGPRDVEATLATIFEPIAWRMARDGAPYRGVLYAGLMLTDAGPMVLEFNARFGDPEAQVLLPLLDGDLAGALRGTAAGDRAAMESVALATDRAAVGIVLAAEGYPDAPISGRPLRGADPAAAGDEGPQLCFHAGTRRAGDGHVSTGGRVVTFVGTGSDHAAGREQAMAAVTAAELEGGQHRSDIADVNDTGASGVTA